MSCTIYSFLACKAIESHLLWQDVQKRLEALIEYCYHAGAAEKCDDMRCVVQRVDRARVIVGGEIISITGKGLLVFLGIEKGDTNRDADFLLEKIVNLRIFEDSQGKMNLSLVKISGEILIISQFTLLADCGKGRRPSFMSAEEPEAARKQYEYFVSLAREKIEHVATGEFQAMMKIESVNDGPVTMLLDSRKTF